MQRSIPLLLLAAAALTAMALLMPGPAAGAVSYRCTDNYAIDDSALQAAIDSGGTVSISGICLGNWDVNNDVTLQAGSPRATLDGNQSGPVLTIHPGITAGIEGLTITNGSFYGGGGIYAGDAFGATINLVRSTVSGNAGCFGGGIFLQGNFFVSDVTLNLANADVDGNTAVGCFDNSAGFVGGGIYASEDAVVNATGSRISGNTAPGEDTQTAGFDQGGGGMWMGLRTHARLIDTTISRNSSGRTGGGIFAFGAIIEATDSTISGNDTNLLGPALSYAGGGIDAFISEVTLTNSSVRGNSTFGNGGGINFGDGPGPTDLPPNSLFDGLHLVDSSVDHNTAMQGTGGGIDNYADERNSHVLLTDSSVSFNNAPGDHLDGRSGGGGISNHGIDTLASGVVATVVANGSIIQGNLARGSVGGGIANFDDGGAALVTLTQTTVGPAPYALNQNQARYGGGIYNRGATGNVTLQPGTNVVHNRAFVTGGGVFDDCGATLSIAPGAQVLLNIPNQTSANPGPCLGN